MQLQDPERKPSKKTIGYMLRQEVMLGWCEKKVKETLTLEFYGKRRRLSNH